MLELDETPPPKEFETRAAEDVQSPGASANAVADLSLASPPPVAAKDNDTDPIGTSSVDTPPVPTGLADTRKSPKFESAKAIEDST